MRISCALWVLAIAAVSSAADSQVEFRGEYFFNRDSFDFFELTNEHWPATIEMRFCSPDSGGKNRLGLAFSLGSTPKIHEKLRLGLAFDIDPRTVDPLNPHRVDRDNRFYIYGRSEFDWATFHLLYPLAQNSKGHDWHWRVEIDDLRYPILSSGDFVSSAIADASYSPDPDLGLDYNCGLRFQYKEYWIDATTECFSVGATIIR